MICQRSSALPEQNEQPNSQINHRDERQVEPAFKMLVTGDHFEVHIVNRVLDSEDVFENRIWMEDRIPRIIPYTLAFKVAGQRFCACDFLIVEVARSQLGPRTIVVPSHVEERFDVVALTYGISKGGIVVDRLRLNTVRSIDPFNSIIGDRGSAQTIPQVQDAYYDERDCYRQNGNKLGRAHRFFHLKTPSRFFSRRRRPENRLCCASQLLFPVPHSLKTN